MLLLKIAWELRQKRNFSIQKLRKTIDLMKKLLHKVTHPLIELTFLIDEERILVFNGDVVMDEISADNHFKFCVGELREEIDDFLAPSPAMIQKKNLAAALRKPRNPNPA